MFLKLDTIEGESTDSKHKGEIEILSYSFGLANPPTGGSDSGGAGSGKASFQDFHFVSRTQKSSPTLFQASATGSHFKQALITVRKAGGGQQEFLKITLNEVLVTSFQQGGTADSADTTPTESISLNFAKVTVVYSQVQANGSLGDGITGTWDRTTTTG